MVKNTAAYYICALLVLGNLSCKKEPPESSDPNLARKKLAVFAKTMNLVFPTETRLVNYEHTTGWLDDSILLKIEFARTELATFLNNSPFKGERLRTKEDNPIPNIAVNAGLSWWDVSSVKMWKTGQVQLPNAKCLNILIGLDHEDTVVVYLEWFET